MAKIVIALGGNALGNTPEEQKIMVKYTSSIIADLVEEGHTIIIGHGNGPQVGMINLAMDFSSKNGGKTPAMPLTECVAMSQGYIGYHIQQGLKVELNKRGIKKDVVTVLTQVVVDKDDPNFLEPTKPIGSFYTKEEAEIEVGKTEGKYIEDANRGYRRVVASPIPIDIIEIETINNLIDNGNIVITVGGGGIPVIKDSDKIIGVEAVIDKDMSCELLAEKIHADTFVILTAVDNVYINYNKINERKLDTLTVEAAKKYIGENQFTKGSMLPKILAAIKFIEKNRDKQVLITSLTKAKAGIEGKAGTRIVYK